MLTLLLQMGALVALTVAIHAAGLALLFRALTRAAVRPGAGFWPVAGRLVAVAWALILIHLASISVWALFYLWQGCLPDARTAFYFSGVTYTTLGYGDVVLSEPWRLLAPVESLTGILMCGLSTGLFFAVVSRIVGAARAGAATPA